MLIHLIDYLTFENIYLWTTFGILPFWLMILIIPGSKFTQIFVNSIVLPIILGFTYAFIIFQIIKLDEPIIEIFKLYLSLDDLYTVFATESFLLIFWLHFLTINLFLATWVSKDGLKYNVPRFIVSISLILIYFSGPLGLVIYWSIRIFYAKRLSFYD
jgi:hypothetical protein